MIQAAFNNLIVTVEVKHLVNLANMIKAANINPGSQINPADYANIISTVVSVPKQISKRRDYEGFSIKDIRPGDKAIMRYDVVWNWEEQADGTTRFKNMFWYKGQEYFVANIQTIFAVIRNGQIRMVNGYCMIEKMTKPMQIVLPTYQKRAIKTSSAILTQIGASLTNVPGIDAFPGDTVFFNPGLVQNYKVGDKEFGILSQKHILGKQVASYEDVAILN